MKCRQRLFIGHCRKSCWFISSVVDEMQALRSVRQQDGIQAAKKAGRRFGRPAFAYPRSWKHILGQWQAREISASDASRKLKMSRSTFYRMVKRYQQGENGGHEGCLS